MEHSVETLATYFSGSSWYQITFSLFNLFLQAHSSAVPWATTCTIELSKLNQHGSSKQPQHSWSQLLPHTFNGWVQLSDELCRYSFMLSSTVAPQRIRIKITECDVNNNCNYWARGSSGHWTPSLSAYCHSVPTSKFKSPTDVGKSSAKCSKWQTKSDSVSVYSMNGLSFL